MLTSADAGKTRAIERIMEEAVPIPVKPAAPRKSDVFSWLKPAVFTASVVPLAVLLLRWQAGLLDQNSVAEVLNYFGLLALILLILSLTCTPLQWLMKWTWPIRVRKLLGLMAFFYATLHFLTYVWKDKEFQIDDIFSDIWKRKFILVGFTAFVLLIPLAITSTGGMIRRLGAKRWQRLHKLAYVAGILGVVHFFLRVKIDITEPVVYGSVLALLLGLRIKAKISAARPVPERRKTPIPLE